MLHSCGPVSQLAACLKTRPAKENNWAYHAEEQNNNEEIPPTKLSKQSQTENLPLPHKNAFPCWQLRGTAVNHSWGEIRVPNLPPLPQLKSRRTPLPGPQTGRKPGQQFSDRDMSNSRAKLQPGAFLLWKGEVTVNAVQFHSTQWPS